MRPVLGRDLPAGARPVRVPAVPGREVRVRLGRPGVRQVRDWDLPDRLRGDLVDPVRHVRRRVLRGRPGAGRVPRVPRRQVPDRDGRERVRPVRRRQLLDGHGHAGPCRVRPVRRRHLRVRRRFLGLHRLQRGQVPDRDRVHRGGRVRVLRQGQLQRGVVRGRPHHVLQAGHLRRPVWPFCDASLAGCRVAHVRALRGRRERVRRGRGRSSGRRTDERRTAGRPGQRRFHWRQGGLRRPERVLVRGPGEGPGHHAGHHPDPDDRRKRRGHRLRRVGRPVVQLVQRRQQRQLLR